MVRRILLTLDGSHFAEAALPAAVALASGPGGELRLLAALEIPPIFVYPEYRSDDRAKTEEYLDTIAKRVVGVDRVTAIVREGHVEKEILSEATEWKADVMVMATHGRGGASRAWIGSTADRCVRESGRPVLLIRVAEAGGVDPTAALAVGRVVVALDGSELAEEALPFAATLARSLSIPIALVRVVTYLPAPEFPWGPVYNGEMNENLIAAESTAAMEYLAPVAQRLRADGATVTVHVPRDIQPARAILAEAGRDLVVITTRGLGRVHRALLGTATDKVIRGAVGPVLVIPGGDATV